jgi:clan AA aspartic protease
MITGIVNSSLEATLRLTVLGPGGRTCRIQAVVDTGFDGFLSLPPALIAELELVWNGKSQATLADGSITSFDTYDGMVVWERRRKAIFIDEADTTPLIGTALLADFEMKAHFRPRGKVMIKSLRGWRLGG